MELSIASSGVGLEVQSLLKLVKGWELLTGSLVESRRDKRKKDKVRLEGVCELASILIPSRLQVWSILMNFLSKET